MRYLILILAVMLISCGGKRKIDRQMDSLFLKASYMNLRYRNCTTTQVKYLMDGKKDSAQFYEDSAMIYYNAYFIYMRAYDSLQLLFNK